LKLKSILLLSLLLLLALPFSGCKGDNENFTIPIYINNPGAQDPATILTDIYITPGWINVAIGDSQLFEAVARYGDGHEAPFTGNVIWVVDGLDWTSNRGYFPAPGKLVTTQAGNLTVSVRFNGGLHGSATVGVFNPDADLPPKPPMNLDYSLFVDNDVYLTWDITPPAESDLLGFNVYRSRVSGTGYVQLNHAPILNPFYRDDEAAGGIFYYVVTTIDTGSMESDYSYELLVDKR
jgi:hypothetical protein